MSPAIRKILVANRGEIALRVMRTCRELNIGTVAIYSEVDKASPHARYADEAYLVGPAPSRESYLNQARVLEVAKKSNADAIHPGYGFLSENADFVDLVGSAGLIFIGPPSGAIRLMGDKTAARKLAQSVGVPIVPGTVDPINSIQKAKAVADEITYPILIKAAGGGGGKGMRIVRISSELETALKSSRSEAKSAFGDDRVYIEKYIEEPRHIEVQVLGDALGNIVHLGERECSVQRRHQKIIEESPSTYLDTATRAKLTEAALALAKAAGYVNAGTMEFIADKDHNFFFLEMNTRLQVEHPVTEMRVSLDLVKEQIRIAEGKRLSFSQNDLSFSGHAIECRIYAEDPLNSFYPSTGQIDRLQAPSGNGIREDRGVEEGGEISPYYDPLISKLVAWGSDRTEALERMIRALNDYRIYGVRNNLSLCAWIMQEEHFRAGNYSTAFLERYFTPECLQKPVQSEIEAGILAALLSEQMLPRKFGAREQNGKLSKWKMQSRSSER